MNLIICNSTFQTFLAEKIIDLYPEEKFCAIVLAPISNKKQKYYYEILKKKCNFSLYLNVSEYGFRQVEHIWQIKNIFKLLKQVYKWKINKNSKCFIGSVEQYITHCLLSFIKPTEIYTYDDGTANIIKSGYFYDAFKNFTIRGELFNKIFNINYDLNKVKKESKLHYTIFPNMENIIKNTQYLDLFRNFPIQSHNKKSINLFIGQNLENIHLIKKIVQEYNIHYYFPHPSEKYKIDNIEYINTPLIFEDYFVQNLADKNVTIYTFFSTAALNVASLPNVKIISIKPKGIKDKSFLEAYDIFQEMGIEVIDYDDSRID